MKHLSQEQLRVLETLSGLWPEARLVLVGAAGLAFSIDMRWRATQDLDLAVTIDLDQFPGQLAHLPGYQQELPHRWRSSSGVAIDLLPCGPKSLRRGSIPFEGGDREMNLAGFDLALDWTMKTPRLPHNVAVAPAAVIVPLKMTAWLDRRADRQRDLQDIAHVLELYLPDLDERRWTEFSERGLQFDEQSPFAVGFDLGERTQSHHRNIVESFLEHFGADSPFLGVMRRLAPVSARIHEGGLERRLEAFRNGLLAGQARRR